MKTTVGFKKGLAKVRRDWREQRFDRALIELNRLLESYPDHPKLLIMRAGLIPLQEDEDDLPTLESAKVDLKQAVALDDESPQALIDLGYYIFVHENDAKAASRYFEKAVDLCADLFTQALVGHAEALSELGQETKASISLMEACSLVAYYPGSIREYIFERIKDLMENTLEAKPASANGSQRSSN